MSETISKLNGNLWLYFIRFTAGIAWIVFVWTATLLIQVDKNQVLLTERLLFLDKRLIVVESRNAEADKEELKFYRDKFRVKIKE